MAALALLGSFAGCWVVVRPAASARNAVSFLIGRLSSFPAATPALRPPPLSVEDRIDRLRGVNADKADEPEVPQVVGPGESVVWDNPVAWREWRASRRTHMGLGRRLRFWLALLVVSLCSLGLALFSGAAAKAGALLGLGLGVQRVASRVSESLEAERQGSTWSLLAASSIAPSSLAAGKALGTIRSALPWLALGCACFGLVAFHGEGGLLSVSFRWALATVWGLLAIFLISFFAIGHAVTGKGGQGPRAAGLLATTLFLAAGMLVVLLLVPHYADAAMSVMAQTGLGPYRPRLDLLAFVAPPFAPSYWSEWTGLVLACLGVGGQLATLFALKQRFDQTVLVSEL